MFHGQSESICNHGNSTAHFNLTALVSDFVFIGGPFNILMYFADFDRDTVFAPQLLALAHGIQVIFMLVAE